MDKEEEVKKVFQETALQALSIMYTKYCGCRQDFTELAQNLNPVFHLEECLYRRFVEPIKLEFKDE